MEHHKASVFLVAANRLLREALVRLLSKRGDFYVCGVSPCVPDTTSSVNATGADVLILDSVIARLSDSTFISKIASEVPNVKMVLIGMDNDQEIFLECVGAGAMGYILKDASAAEVVSGVQAVAQGQAVCPPHLCAYLFRSFSRQWTAIPSARIKLEFGLTRRQQQIVPLIAQGLTNKEIASHLNLSEQTVKNHIHGIMRRVGAGDRLQVIDLTRISRVA
ncbi:MAG: response regulator transcription factor [Acidobacteriia bacterium]|nr:response regulator transcription factor [Terriglobia bacterium]